MKYTTVSGDTWDQISFKVYGDCKYENLIILNNIEHVECVVFPAGIELNIHELSYEQSETLPPWKR